MTDTATTTLDQGVDELLDADLSRLSSIEVMGLLCSLERLRRRLDAVDHRVVSEVESRRLAGDYARSTTADLLVTSLRVSPGEARARVTRAGDLSPRSSLSGEQLPPLMPATSDAVAAGDIAAAHVAVITNCLDRLPPALPPDAVEIVESTLVTAARHEHPGHLRRTAALLLARLDPDGPEPAEAQWRRELNLARTADGLGRFRGRLTPEATAVWDTILDTLSAPVPAADGMPDVRSPGQRRHDALLDAGHRLLRSGTLPAAGGMPVTVLVRTTAADLRATTPASVTPAAPDSRASDLGAPDLGTPDLHGPDLHAPDLHAPDLHAPDLYLPDLHAPDFHALNPSAITALSPSGTPRPRNEMTGQPHVDAASRSNPGHRPPADADSREPAGPDPRTPTGPSASPGGPTRGVGLSARGDVLDLTTLMPALGDGATISVGVDERGAVLHLGQTRRLATCPQRLALAARDGGCSFPGCDRPAAWTEVHHVIPWQLGGPTDVDNLCLLCRYHHREFEPRGWSVRMTSGLPEWTPPPFIDPAQRPVRNITHHPPDLDFDVGRVPVA